MRLADNEPNIQQKVSALFAIGVNSNKLFRLSPYEIPLEVRSIVLLR